MRVAPPTVLGNVARSPRPAAGTPGADAHRQTGFVLGGELAVVLAGLRLEAELAAQLASPRRRTQQAAGVLAVWSRGWLSRLQALHAAEGGNYAAAMPLIRTAADYLAAEIALLGTDGTEWQEWATTGGVALAPAQHALEYRLHPFRSGEALASHPELSSVYRMATDLSLPHFGATLLLAGSASDANRIAVTFGDRDFHVGLAEIVIGWLVQLCSMQVTAAVEGAGAALKLQVPPALSGQGADEQELLSRIDRCRVEVVELDDSPRYLIHNFRRQPSGAPHRLLL